MTNKLYEDGNNEVDFKMPVENVLKPKPQMPVFPTSLADVKSNAKTTVAPTPSSEKKVFFTCSKRKASSALNLDDSEIAPNGSVILSGKKTKEKYIKQLESLLYTNDEELDFDNMVKVLIYYNLAENSGGPIYVTSTKFPKKIPLLIEALNEFFSENKATLDSIVTMMNGKRKEGDKEVSLEELNNVK